VYFDGHISEPATETVLMCPSDDDVELDDSIADEDYVPPSNASDSSSGEESLRRVMPRILKILESPAVPDESCEIPFFAKQNNAVSYAVSYDRF